MTSKTTTKLVPATAYHMTVGEFLLGDNGENAKSAPITIVARTGKPVEHWYWGRMVHDFGGMKLHKDRLPIDYCHNPDQIIGYLNNFETDSGDLIASGALTPWKDSDRATEIIFKSGQGVPYEASIDFTASTTIEEVAEGKSVEVNGETFDGPGIVFRQWHLRGVAVCPYGADMYTESKMNEGDEVVVSVIYTQTHNGDSEMTNDTVETEAPAEVVETESELTAEIEAPAEVVEAETELTAEIEAPAAIVEAESETVQPEAELSSESVDADETVEPEANETPSAPGEQYMHAFGETDGAIYFAKGMSFDEAMAAHCDKLTARVTELESRLAARSERGLAAPVEFSDIDRESKSDTCSLADIIGGEKKQK